jgi:hypothetical protein
MKPSARNILSVIKSASLSQTREGMEWYVEANAIATDINPANPDCAAGVIAALSPMQRWEVNVRNARLAFENGYAGGTFFRNAIKADRIMAGKDWRDVLKGHKVRNFAALISNPADFNSVCIDRHAFDIAVGRVTDDSSRKILERVGVYDKFVQAYKNAAESLDILPWQVQAITWVAWRAS